MLQYLLLLLFFSHGLTSMSIFLVRQAARALRRPAGDEKRVLFGLVMVAIPHES